MNSIIHDNMSEKEKNLIRGYEEHWKNTQPQCNSQEVTFDHPKEYRQDGTGELKLVDFEHLYTGQLIQFYQFPPSYVKKMMDMFDGKDRNNEASRQEAEKKGEKIRERGLPVLTVAPEPRLRDPRDPDLERGFPIRVDPNRSEEMDSELKNEEFTNFIQGNEYSYLDNEIHEWIKDRAHQYLQFLGIPYLGLRSSNSWMNDSEAGEYNPLHRHNGSPGYFKAPFNNHRQQIGLVLLIALYVPAELDHPGEGGKDGFISGADRNGHTEWIFASHDSQFCKPSLNVKLATGQVVVFPYDMFHTVYPHYNKKETRRTYSHNIDVFLEEFAI